MKKEKNGTRWAFIINPVAGRGKTVKYIAYLQKCKHDLHPEIDLFVTERPGHATEICNSLIRNGYRRFVAVGGDGTFNEVVQSLVPKKNCVLGIFPSGSGNDYAPGAGFPDHYEPWELADLFRCREVPVDVGKCNGRYFLNNVGFGFDAKVATDFSNAKHNLGKINYWYFVIKNIFFFRPSRFIMTFGKEKISLKSLLVSFGIGRRCGGGFQLTPRALINDALMDICIIENTGVFGRVMKLAGVAMKKHIGSKGVHYILAKSAKIEFDRDVNAHLDGETFMGRKFDITLIPGAVRLLVHPERENYCRKEKKSGK
jgi:diacylglycerol kinase (ATP)